MTLAMMIHIAGGTAGLVGGFGALAVAKGERWHRMLGTAFFVGMLTMSGFGAVMAIFIPSRITIVAGSLTFYLVATAWMTVRRPENAAGRFEVGAAVAATLIALGAVGVSVAALISPTGRLDGLPPQPVLGFALVAALAAWCDGRLVRRGGIAGPRRIARHLWRMTTALLIAALSFFLGQQKMMPQDWRGSPLLYLPPLLVFAALVFWMLRVRLSRRWAAAPP
ncbi:MAG: hypothetical protein JWR84_2685 [Caulobacter sp.]|nr:hypothetical protein [Caulobacter sp.]